jgi:PAS domain S-box-containing protein
MAGERLMIVEDEKIVAEDLRDMLEHLGYKVVATATSGEEAIHKAEEARPELILMDIRLNGELDGIQAAEVIWATHEIPVTYLTAYADESTLERAKATMPFGYILKPFEERDLRTTIEIALYKHGMEKTMRKIEGWHASALEGLGDAVFATNSQGCITFMNPAAETLTGWPLRQVYGKKFEDTFGLLSVVEATRTASSTGHLKTRQGREIEIAYGISPIKDESGHATGNLVVLHQGARSKEANSASN